MPTPPRQPKQVVPPDQDQRDLIRTELDRNLLVEAAAGTGKTTALVDRMVALLRTGACREIRTLAAVTFTRKAAAELRGRFQVALEQGAREARGGARRHLQAALDHVAECSIGTIHSFCSRLLRERPVEAGVDLDFVEADEESDARLREEAWQEYVNRCYAGLEGDSVEALDRVGLGLGDLRDAFFRFCDFPDVEEWPAKEAPRPKVTQFAAELQMYLDHVQELLPSLPDDHGTDDLIPTLRRLARMAPHYDREDPAQLMELLAACDRSPKLVQRPWKETKRFTGDDAKEELARWDSFRQQVVIPALRAWREHRYPILLRVLFSARAVYDELRRSRGLLNFQDLLLKAAALLRDQPHVRRYFQERFTHLLVDEFQDTDPIQAEVMLLLTADDPTETTWRDCRPRPGSLFVVGDPKQSIYRFRRADIVTYNEVKAIIAREGRVVQLSTNFRSAAPLIEWVNAIFAPESKPAAPDGPWLRFGDEACDESPAYVPLQVSPEPRAAGGLCGVYPLTIPDTYPNREAITDYEADRIARTIRHALDSGLAATPSDFLLITRNTMRLSLYARKLQEYGLPHQVTGGGALNEVPELRLFHLCLVAVNQPDNPVALVAVLRSELFGVSDAALYRFKKLGGRFDYREGVPAGLPPADAEAFQDPFARLRRYAEWLDTLPALAAFERVIADLGVLARAAARPGGDIAAGSLAKAVELLRRAQTDLWTTAQLVEYAGKLAQSEERHDGLSARSAEEPAVRVMNLHKCKGLEASIVFLADPYGEFEHPVELHIDRSGVRVLGFLAVSVRRSEYTSELLALPPGWADREARERRFASAETLRLRYVAATRAGSALIITQCEKSRRHSPWGFFSASLSAAEDLADPGPQSAPARETVSISPEEVEGARADIAHRTDAVRTATYRIESVRAEAARVSQGDRTPSEDGDGDGTEWGAVIHALLEIAMVNPDADLVAPARAALAAHDLPLSRAVEAVGAARAVARSEIWQRALRAGQRFVEVPFRIRLEEQAEVPTLRRGVIDLIFWESDGWVLVDYKTDPLPGRIPPHYEQQVRLYAESWQRITQQPVKEVYLYFTRDGALVAVSLPAQGMGR